MSDYQPSDEEDGAWPSDTGLATTQNEATLNEELGDLAVLLKEEFVHPDTVVFPPLPPEYIPLRSEQKLEDFLEGRLTLLRGLERKTSGPMRGLLAEIDEHGYKDEFKIYTSHAFKDILLGDEPPTLQMFLSLPSLFDLSPEILRSHFLDYIHVWRKDIGVQTIFHVYTGVAASALDGANNREQQYNVIWRLGLEATESQIKKCRQHCRTIAADGFVLDHVGVALIAPRSVKLAPLQAYMKGMEGTVTYVLWSAKKATGGSHKDHYLRRMCPWDVDDLPYGGLNSHNPLCEGIRRTSWDEEFLRSLPLDPSERHRFIEQVVRDRDRQLFALKEKNEIRASDEEYKKAKTRKELKRGNERIRTARANEILIAKEKNEIRSSDEEYQKANQRQVRQKATRLNHYAKDRAVVAAKEDHEIRSSDEEYKQAKKRLTAGNLVHAREREQDKEVTAARQKGLVPSSDEKYQAAVKRRKQKKNSANKGSNRDKELFRKRKDNEIRSSDVEYQAAKKRKARKAETARIRYEKKNRDAAVGVQKKGDKKTSLSDVITKTASVPAKRGQNKFQQDSRGLNDKENAMMVDDTEYEASGSEFEG